MVLLCNEVKNPQETWIFFLLPHVWIPQNANSIGAAYTCMYVCLQIALLKLLVTFPF